MSKLNTTRSTGKSIGFPSQKQLDMWSSQGRRKASLFSKKQSLTINPRRNSKLSIDNDEEINFAFDSSLNQLRQKTKTEKSNSSTISNRMSYLEVDLRRKRQMMELAKNKYHKMIEVRHRSFVEKKQLTKEREIMNKEYKKTVTLKASRVRAQRNNSAVSAQVIKQKNQADAARIKNQRFINQKMVAQRKQREVQKKKAMVETSQKYADLSKQKLKSFEQKKFKEAKANHNCKMLEQYLKGQMQKRKNNTLMKSFKSKVRKIQQQNSQINKELSQYEKMLGWHYSSRNGNRKQSSSSFYMTH